MSTADSHTMSSTPMAIDWNSLMPIIWQYGQNIVAALITIFIGGLVIAWLGRIAESGMTRSGKLTPEVCQIFKKLIKAGLWSIVVVMVLGQFGVQTASIVAVLGALGLAIGLALQGTLSNIASGVMIMILKPFSVGSVIKVGGDVWIIDSIGLFVTNAHQPEGPKATLPNNNLWGSNIVTLTECNDGVKRIDQVIGISYGDDIEVAMNTAKAVIAADDRYLSDPEPLIAVSELGDSSVNILVRVFTTSDDWWPAKLALTKELKIAYDKAGLSIPFPQRDVHLIQEKDS